MQIIYTEIMDIKDGKSDPQNNVLKNAPHTSEEATGDIWDHPYKRSTASYPVSWITTNKFWPSVARLDDAYGDRNLVCSCTPIEEYRNLDK